MPLPIYRLRRWLAAIAVLFVAVIAAMYFYARMRERNVLKEIPNKLGFDIKQTASGFQFSKSDGKRTLFTIQASDLTQFKLNGNAELHNVSIVIYGRDSDRFDQIYGDVFSYDKKSGDVKALGEVQIDLEANPAGLSGPDQGTPKELKNPIHLKTRDLVFNQGSGDASTEALVDFGTPQAGGSAVGMQYSAKSNTLTLGSQIHVTLGGPNAASIYASHGRVQRNPRVIALEHARLERNTRTVQADEATFFLGPDNHVERVLAKGNVTAQDVKNADQLNARADEAEMLLTGEKNLLHTATLTGNVHVERSGSQPIRGDAGRVILDFIGQNELRKIHAAEDVRLEQHAANAVTQSANGSPPQDFDIAAAAIDFFIEGGRRLDHAETSGAARITISPAQSATRLNAKGTTQPTVITAGRFEAKFATTPEGGSRLASVHGEPEAKIVSSSPGQPDRVSTSNRVDAGFLPQGGIASIIQQGSVVYNDGLPPDKRTQVWADKAVYTPADHILTLTGAPRIAEGGMVTTGQSVRIDRTTDDAFADGDVKSTYNDLKAQPDGAWLASASPIHVTAARMTAHNSTAIARYEGKARLWQDANVISAPSIEFDRNHRSLVAQGTAGQPVSTVLVRPAGKSLSGKTSYKAEDKAKGKPEDNSAAVVTITSSRLTYADDDRKAHYEEGVVAKGDGFTATSNTLDAYLERRNQTPDNKQVGGPSKLDHMVAEGGIVMQQPDRSAQGEKLVYTASDDKFVLTGGPPSIFDAERGKITGVSLTFYRADDRVLVEGEASTPVVTQTRVAR
jgi:lipopolysaccharide export system protein LptA